MQWAKWELNSMWMCVCTGRFLVLPWSSASTWNRVFSFGGTFITQMAFPHSSFGLFTFLGCSLCNQRDVWGCLTWLDCYLASRYSLHLPRSLALSLSASGSFREPRSPELIQFLTEHTLILHQGFNCISVPITLMTITYFTHTHTYTRNEPLLLTWYA